MGRLFKTYSGSLEMGCDAEEYWGEMREDCEAGVPSTSETGETAELAELCWLPNIVSKRRRAPNHTLLAKTKNRPAPAYYQLPGSGLLLTFNV